MTFSAMKFSRVRMLALLLVAVFSFAAIGATSVASASDASTSAKKKAKKKAKKCKKAVKKSKAKCKKSKGSKGKTFIATLGSVASSPEASVAKKKTKKKAKKKCKKGYQRVGTKCKRKPFVITPDSITLVAGVLKQRMFASTGYSFFPRVARDAVLRGYWHISNGIGYERLKVEWKVFKGQDYLNFGDLDRKVGLSGREMTATLVVKGVRSNAYPIEQK